MRPGVILFRVGLPAIFFQSLVICETRDILNIKWPKAPLSWLVVEEGFPGDEVGTRVQNDSKPGFFCHGKQPEFRADPAPFPINDGKLEFYSSQQDSAENLGVADPSNYNWTIKVFFVEFHDTEKGQKSFSAEPSQKWHWKGERQDDGAYCSTSLGSLKSITEATGSSNNRTTGDLSDTDLDGLQATLAVEIIGYDSQLTTPTHGFGKNTAIVMRQCIPIQFTSRSELYGSNPCMSSHPLASSPSQITTDVSAQSLGKRHPDNLALWVMLPVILIVAVWAASTVWLMRIRRRERKDLDESESHPYDVMRGPGGDPPEFVHTAQGSLPPSYEQAIGSEQFAIPGRCGP